jgi:hypothetical protein
METGFTTLVSRITADPIIYASLSPLGLIQFGRGSDGCYDPVCFDTSRRLADGDCPVVRVEHESLLCDDQIGEVDWLFNSFRELVNVIVAASGS